MALLANVRQVREYARANGLDESKLLDVCGVLLGIRDDDNDVIVPDTVVRLCREHGNPMRFGTAVICIGMD